MRLYSEDVCPTLNLIGWVMFLIFFAGAMFFNWPGYLIAIIPNCFFIPSLILSLIDWRTYKKHINDEDQNMY